MVVGFALSSNMMGLRGNFGFLVLIGWALGVCSCSIAMGMGCLVPNVKNVTELMPVVYLPQILFAGFFIRSSQIPVFLRWAQYLCAIKYAVNLEILNEFRVSNPECSKNIYAKMNCETLLKVNDVYADQYYVYIIILIVLAVGFRVLGGIVLHYKAKRFY